MTIKAVKYLYAGIILTVTTASSVAIGIALAIIACSGDTYPSHEEFDIVPGPYPIETSKCDKTTDNPCCPPTPIILDLAGDGARLGSVADGVNFDVVPKGVVELTAWTLPGSDDAWLVWDRDNDGLITTGEELWGNYSEPHQPHGYMSLAVHDADGDGKITAMDPLFPLLRLWRDANHDGVTQPGELLTLSSKGITGIDLHFEVTRVVDAYGNLWRYRAAVFKTPSSPVGKWSYDVFPVNGTLVAQAHGDPLQVPFLPVTACDADNVLCPIGSRPNCQVRWGDGTITSHQALCSICAGAACRYTCSGYRNCVRLSNQCVTSVTVVGSCRTDEARIWEDIMQAPSFTCARAYDEIP